MNKKYPTRKELEAIIGNLLIKEGFTQVIKTGKYTYDIRGVIPSYALPEITKKYFSFIHLNGNLHVGIRWDE